MERVDGSITTQYGDGNSEQFLFTYDENERQEREIDRNNAKLMFKPKFIPFYISLVGSGLSTTEILLYGFIDFYLGDSKDRFYFTNEQLGEILGTGIQTISNGIKKLKDMGLIDVSYKIRADGGKIRFIKNLYPDYKNFNSGTIKKFIINNNNINNNNINNITPLKENDLPLNQLAVSEKERKVALKERKLEMPIEEYEFVDEFLDRGNGIVAYCFKKYPNYLESQMVAVDKLVKQGYPLEVIKLALMYIKQDKFWSKNILSVKKLLEKNKDGIPYMVVIIDQMKNYKPVVANI